jgi:hypothetical protein
MIRRDIALLIAAAVCVSCATVVDQGETTETAGDGDGDLVAGDGDGDDTGSGGVTISTDSGGASSGDSGGSLGSGGGSPSGGSSPGAGGGEPSGTTLFSDDFEAGTDQWTFGEGWATASDGTTVFEQSIMDSTTRIAYAGEMWGDVVISGRMKILDGEDSSSAFAGFMLRTVDDQNGLILAFQTNGALKIKSISGGSDSSLSSEADDFVVETNVWYDVRFQIINQSMIAFVNDQPVLSYSHPGANITGMIGVATKRATAVFDDIVVTTP